MAFVFRQTLTVSYHSPNSSDTLIPKQYAQAQTSNTTGDFPTLTASVVVQNTIPTKTGYVFKGWSLTASAPSVDIVPGNTISRSANQYTWQGTDLFLHNSYVDLYAVWEASTSTISAPNGTMGSSITISITKSSNSFTDTITYKFGSATGTIVTKTSASSVSWSIPISLASQITNSKTGTCTLTTTTYNGNTSLGTNSITITLTVPSSTAPTVSVALSETVSAVQNLGLSSNTFVQSQSKVNVTITATGQYSASISSYSTSINNASYTGASITTGVLLSSGSNTCSAKATDSRGYSTTQNKTFTVLPYYTPTISFTADRNSADTSQIDVVVTWGIAPLNDGTNKNSKSYKIEYKLKSASTYTTFGTITPSGYSGTASHSITGTDSDQEYSIKVTVYDAFTSLGMIGQVGADGNIIIDSRHVGGVGIGMASQSTNQLDVGKHTVFHETVDVVPRRAYAFVQNAGWYRVLQFDAENSAMVQGDDGFLVNVTIVEWARQIHKISLAGVLGKLAFVDEFSYTQANYIDKIRYTQNGTHGYIDVHFIPNAGGNRRRESCYFDIKTIRPEMQQQFTSVDFVAVADAPSGETILTTYTFYANGTGTSNGWEYRILDNKKIIATRTIEQSIASYATWNGFYGYNLANISTPFTMTNTTYYVTATWKIGSGFSILAGVTGSTTTSFNLLGLGSAGGTQDCVIRLYLEGTIA